MRCKISNCARCLVSNCNVWQCHEKCAESSLKRKSGCLGRIPIVLRCLTWSCQATCWESLMKCGELRADSPASTGQDIPYMVIERPTACLLSHTQRDKSHHSYSAVVSLSIVLDLFPMPPPPPPPPPPLVSNISHIFHCLCSVLSNVPTTHI